MSECLGRRRETRGVVARTGYLIAGNDNDSKDMLSCMSSEGLSITAGTYVYKPYRDLGMGTVLAVMVDVLTYIGVADRYSHIGRYCNQRDGMYSFPRPF